MNCIWNFIGCYTTHADQKRWNRRCEGLLYQAELFASLATFAVAYPKSDLSAAWKKVLFNHFTTFYLVLRFPSLCGGEPLGRRNNLGWKYCSSR